MLKNYYKEPGEAGTDEAGRGCLAGPVTAAAVLLPAHFSNKRLNDSKMLSAASRKMLRAVIEEEARSFGVFHIPPRSIDQVNILNASIEAMHGALDQLSLAPSFIIVDGNKFKRYKSLPHQCIVKGDGKFMSIAAASVLAKTYRDAYMENIHEEYPMYNWKQNKGYPTREHRAAILKYGISPYHRKSFRLIPGQLKLSF